MTDLAALKAANAKRWANARLTRGPEFVKPAQKAFANKARYVSIAKRSGMPEIAWLFVAVSHYRESSQDFTKNLGQGDPLNRVTVHVPAGRGPFLGPTAFEDGAVDALVNCAPYAARNADWSIAGMLTLLERYNGLGYVNHGIPSPYIWSGTDQYVRGKYVADGVFDPNAVDKQLGCAGLILAIAKLDPSVSFSKQATVILPPTPAPPPPDVPRHDPVPQVTPAKPMSATKAVIIATTATAASTTAVAVHQGLNWPAIGLTAFIIGGLATVVVLLIRKFK
jgi:lysozyme family protein